MGGLVEERQEDDFREDGVYFGDVAVLDDGFEVAKFFDHHLPGLGGEADVGEGSHHGFDLVLLPEVAHQVLDKPAYLPDHLSGGL